MKVVKVRSPFIITVAESGQIGSKVELFIWKKDDSIPLTANYTLSKLIASPTQISTYYNVSNFVKEFINNIKPTKFTGTAPVVEDNNEWVNFRVKRFKLVGSTYTELDSIDYVGINAFTKYSDGKNSIENDVVGFTLTNELITKKILKSSSTLKSYFNFLFDVPTGGGYLSYNWNTLDNSSGSGGNTSILSAGVYNYRIPLSIYPDEPTFVDGCNVRVRVVNSVPAIIYEKIITVNSVDEYKYAPVECTFINRYGGWEFLTFFKAQSNSIATKNTKYAYNQNAFSYNTSIGQSKLLNVNGKQSIKLNTGWVNENVSELITDLLLSETVLLDSKPVTLKTQSYDVKSVLKDKMINYEIEFEYDFNLINDVI